MGLGDLARDTHHKLMVQILDIFLRANRKENTQL